MDNLIPKLYAEYGAYVNLSRAIPYLYDGAKPVERKILLVMYEIAREKFIKSARIDGTTTAKYHPHSPIYGTLVNLVNFGFLDGQGNFGNNLGVESSPAAASRYTEVKLNSRFREMFFTNINEVPWRQFETDEIEPEFFPTMFPICLMGGNITEGIGFGCATKIPSYDPIDLWKRLKYLLDPNPNKIQVVIKPTSDCLIISSDIDLINLLETGKGRIEYQGKFTHDHLNRKISINSWPSGIKFEKILSRLQKELDAQDIGFVDQSCGETGTCIDFTVIKKRNMDQIYDSLLAKMKSVLTSGISFDVNLVNEFGRVMTYSIDNLLLRTHKQFQNLTIKNFKTQIEKLEKSKEVNTLILKIRPVLIKCINDKIIDPDEIIKIVSEKIKEPVEVVKDIFAKQSIRKLISVNLDNAELDIKKLEIESNILNIDQFINNTYEHIISKF